MEKKEKHLEFIQSNITRMNQCSFQMKGWAITIVAALLAIFAATFNENCKGNEVYLFVAIAPTALFWILDAYYLSIERKFVAMYNDIILNESETIKDYEMPIKKYTGWKYCAFKSMFSLSEWLLYLGIIVGLVIAGIIL